MDVIAAIGACHSSVSPQRNPTSGQPAMSMQAIQVCLECDGSYFSISTACSTESVGKKPPIYKVMLHNDNYNRREYVVKVLMKVVDSITVDDAVNVMQVGT